MRRERPLALDEIHVHRKTKLIEIAQARRPQRAGAGFRQCGQQNRDQKCDNPDDNQEFNERECPRRPALAERRKSHAIVTKGFGHNASEIEYPLRTPLKYPA